MRNQYKRERERDGEKNNDVKQHISEEFDISQQQQKKKLYGLQQNLQTNTFI